MGTNFYRIPTEGEMIKRKGQLLIDINLMELDPRNIEKQFSLEKEGSFDTETPWDKFLEGTNVHLGKRSAGWLFSWNFHNNKYYSNKETLFSFIRSGRVIDEYGTLIDNEEFIKMALEWGQPNGLSVNEEYRKKELARGVGTFFNDPKYDDRVIDGLRVSAHIEFS